MLPSVIPESVIETFKYWQDQIKVGMYYQNELYMQVKSYKSTERLKAYDHAYQLSEEGVHVCLTASDKGYCLWQNLRPTSSEPVSKSNAAVAAS